MAAAGLLVWGSPPEDAPSFGSRSYDPFWEVASSLELPVSLHCITSGQPKVRSRSPYVQYLDVIYDGQRSLAEIVCGGVLERFPENLIIVKRKTIAVGFPTSCSALIMPTRSSVDSPPTLCPCAAICRNSCTQRFKRIPPCRACAMISVRTGICGLGLSARRFNLATVSENHC